MVSEQISYYNMVTLHFWAKFPGFADYQSSDIYTRWRNDTFVDTVLLLLVLPLLLSNTWAINKWLLIYT